MMKKPEATFVLSNRNFGRPLNNVDSL